MSEAQHKAQGIVGISLMVQIGETLTNELRMITSSFSKVMFKGKPWEISKENFSKKKSKIQKNSKSFQKIQIFKKLSFHTLKNDLVMSSSTLLFLNANL